MAVSLNSASISVNNNPECVCSDGSYVYVISNAASTIQKIDVGTNTIVGSAALTGAPLFCCYDNVNKLIWVSHNGSGIIQGINPVTLAVATSITIPAVVSVGFMLLAGGFLWATCGNENAVAKLNPGNSTFVGIYTLPVSGGGPSSLATDGIGLFVGITALGQGGIYKLSFAGAIIAFLGFGGNNCSVVWDGTNVWAGNDTRLVKTDANLATFSQISFSPAPDILYFDGSYIWIVNIGTPTATVSVVVPFNGGVLVSGTPFNSNSPGQGANAFASDGVNVWMNQIGTTAPGVLSKFTLINPLPSVTLRPDQLHQIILSDQVQPSGTMVSVPIACDFSVNGTVIINLQNAQARNLPVNIQSIFINNKDNNAPITVSFDNGASYTISAGQQAILQVICPSPPVINISSIGQGTSKVWINNFLMSGNAVWNAF